MDKAELLLEKMGSHVIYPLRHTHIDTESNPKINLILPRSPFPWFTQAATSIFREKNQQTSRSWFWGINLNSYFWISCVPLPPSWLQGICRTIREKKSSFSSPPPAPTPTPLSLPTHLCPWFSIKVQGSDRRGQSHPMKQTNAVQRASWETFNNHFGKSSSPILGSWTRVTLLS